MYHAILATDGTQLQEVAVKLVKGMEHCFMGEIACMLLLLPNEQIRLYFEAITSRLCPKDMAEYLTAYAR